jgi:hypothetical protein
MPIVSNAVNDVAITVLDTAPTDPATGLPVPTIAVATAGGVSVIKDDGTVVNSDLTSSSHSVHFSRLKDLFFGSTGFLLFARYVTYISSSFGTALNTTSYSSGAVGVASPKMLGVATTIKALNGAVPSNSGISLLKENPSSISAGMVAYITNAYNSGWMPGDIRGAYLADTTAETITGSGELVTNGTFTTDTSGWTAANGTLSVVGGQLQITNTVANGYAYQTVPTVVGKTYSVSVELVSKTSGNYGVLIGTTAANGSISAVQNISTSGTYSVNFVATATTTFIDVQSYAPPGAVAVFDNISVKLAEPDRSVKKKGLIINGSLTKTAVATGAGLVAYSGFSATNYFEQPPNSSLDFGTGDLFMMGWVNLTAVTNQFLLTRGTPGAGTFAIRLSGTYQYYCHATGVLSDTGVSATTGLHFLALLRVAGTLYFYVDGAVIHSAANTQNISNALAALYFGGTADHTLPVIGSLALWRIGATAPSADQIAHIYRTELPLFQAGAQCTIAGTSTAVTALAYDDTADTLHVGTSWGRSGFKDLLRIDSEATTTGALTSLSAQGGAILTGGTSGKYYQPALLLRDELGRKDEARKALGKVPVFFDYTATASQTAFVAPKGFTIKAVYHNGTLKRETTTGVYWTRSNDGFAETATLSVGATVSDWISLMCVRA